MDKILGRKPTPELKPPDCLSRYVVTKHAWYKKYKRIFCITPTAIHTQNPERTLLLTNSYPFVGDSDIESVTLGTDEFEFIISARQDKKGKFNPLKFTCKHRQLLLTDLFQCMAAASAMARCLVASKVLGPQQDFQAVKWSRTSNGWKPVTLRVAAFGLESLEPQSGAVKWRCDYQRMSSPGIMLLAPYVPPPAGHADTASAVAAAATPQDGVFAVMTKLGRSTPRVFSARARDTLVGQMRQVARKKLAINIIVDSSAASTLQQLLEAVMLAERSSSSEASELPLGQWEVEAMRGRADLLPPQLLMASPAQSAHKLTVEALAGMTDVLVMSGGNTVPRRLVVTPTSLITRRVDSHEVVMRRPLTAIAAVVRFADDPKLLAIEWEDGAAPSQFVTPARDAVLATVLAAAQAAAARPIAVMPGFSSPGDVIITDHKHASHAPASEPEPELTRMYLAELNSRGKELAPVLQGSSMMFYQSHISFNSSPRATRTTFNAPAPISVYASSPGNSSTGSTTPSAAAGASPAAASLSAAAAKLGTPGTSPAAAGYRATAGGDHLTPQDAANVLLECVYEFNACVPYSGVSLVAGEGCELEPQAVAAVLALLPEDLQPGVATPALAPDDVKQAVAVLHCLQRLASHPHLAEQLLSAPTALSRVWACLACGSDHVVAEGARLLVRLFAPAPARHGAAAWRLLRTASPLGAEDFYLTNSREDTALARNAKLLAFPPALQAERLSVLLQPLARPNPPSHLTSMALLEVIAAVAVDPGARTTDSSLQDACLRAAAALGRPLFTLFSHPAARVADGAAVLMRAIAECGSTAAAPMRDAALREGAVLHHLQLALFASGDKAKLSQELVASWADEHPPALALLRSIFPPGLVRYLNAPKAHTTKAPPRASVAVAANAADATQPGSATAQQAPAQGLTAGLEASTVPPAAGGQSVAIVAAAAPVPTAGPGQSDAADGITALTAPGLSGQVPAVGSIAAAPQQQTVLANGNAQHATGGPAHGAASVQPQQQQQQQQAPQPAPKPPRLPEVSGGLCGNWPAFWSAASRDHCHAGLIWNESTRRELRDALDRELAGLRAARTRVAKGGGGWPTWNWSEFSVSYPSTASQLCIGGVYIRLLLEGGDSAAIEKLASPKEFFTACYHTLLCCPDVADTATARTSSNSNSNVPALSSGSAMPESKTTQELCIKAMAAAYSAHAGVIGPFEGIPHILQLLDNTTQRSLRHGLLLFLQALIAPQAAGDLARESNTTASSLPKVSAGAPSIQHSVQDSQQQQPLVLAGASSTSNGSSTIADGSQAAQALTKLTPSQAAAVRAAKANGYLLMDHGGLQLLVDFVAGAHECTERRMAAAAAGAAAGAAAAGAGHLITSISHAEAPKEWYFYPKGYNPEPQNATSTVTKLAAGTTAKGSDGSTAGNLSDGHRDGSQSQPQHYQVGDETICGPDETGRAGPLSKEALKQLCLKRVITLDTWVWAAGMPESQRLREVRELRWMLASGLGLLGPFEAALVALQILQQLANLQPAVDEYGSVLQPLPRAHRGLADPSCLPHIAQVILTGEPALVSAAASLLACILVHNSAALSRLYLTGVFLFGLAYCGSNLTELAALFKTAHLVQAFRGPAEVTAGLPLVQRSYLGVLLPESLLHMLETYGPGVFAAALSGDHDTPEIVWTAGMRQSRLIPAMLQHLGDFAHRLAQHCHAVYEYTPPPPMTWPELADEIWCHRYYLKNLCDEDSFRGWPVVDHIPFLQALMEQWRAELGRQPLAMSEAQACETLGIAAGPGGLVSEDDMRRAYRALARRYHPDKNPSPEARAKFLQIQKAYERLQAGAAGGQGPQAWRLLLMLRAQCILFRRYPAVLAPFKYAGYPQLLEVLRIVTQQSGSAPAAAGPQQHASDSPALASSTKTGQSGATVAARSTAAAAGAQHFLSGDAVEQVLAAIELCWLTCVASKRNAEELMRSGGLPLLAGLLSRCVGILSLDVAPTAAPAVITTHALRTLAGLAAVAAARKEMEQHTQLLADISKCCALTRAPAAVDAALVAICHLSASAHLQHMLLESGVLPYLVPLLLEYDVTLSPETSAGLQLPFTASDAAVTGADGDRLFEASFRTLDSALVRPNMQEARSQHALLAAQALGRLAGMLSEPYQTPSNPAATSALSSLLTQSLAARLSEPDPRPLLICLNSSLETAQVIWNSSMREELSKALAAQRSSGPDLATLQSFTFTSLAGELQVGGVFVRVFNQRGRSGASASNATVTAATAASGATAAAGAAVAAAAAPGGPLSSGSRAAAAPGAAGTAVAPTAAASLQPQDPAAFCKALVRYLYERLVERCYRGSELHMLSRSEAVNVLEVLQALDNLLEAEPRLLGLLSSKSALSPMVACITPAASSYPPLFEQAASAAAGKQTVSEGTPTIAKANSQGITGDSSESEPAADAAQLADTAEQLAALGLQLMSRAIANAAVQEALVDESLLRQLYWLVVQPPSSRVLVGALGLLRRLTGSPLAALVAGYQGGTVLLLSVLLHTGSWPWPGADAATAAVEGAPARASAADVLSQLMGQPTHGPRVRMILGKLLPPGLVAAVAEGPPEAVLRALGQNMENPECMWDARMAAQASAEVSQVAAVIRKQHAGHSYDWSPAPNYQLEYDNLRGEIYVGGVYVRLFLKNPKYAVRDPVKFAEALVERYLQDLTLAAAYADGSAAALDRCLLLSAAAVVLLQGHGLLADHIAQLGYSGRLLSVLATRTAKISAANAAAGQQKYGQQQQQQQQQHVTAAPDELGGSILRFLHQLAAAHGASEALASATGAPLVPTLVSAMAWGHGACILVLETIKRALDMGNRQRDTLVAQALQVGLLEKLLGMLDWRSGISGGDSEQPAGEAGVDSSPVKSQAHEQEQALERALAVDVLRLLAEEGSYSAQVSAVLARSPIWAAYRDQRHDMFLPSGATAESGVVGLLTAGDTARYALPAPESVQGQGHHA